jgi:feruloyl-CoA synthase
LMQVPSGMREKLSMRGLLAGLLNRGNAAKRPQQETGNIRSIAYAPVALISEKGAGGSLILRARAALQSYNPSLGQMFRAAAAAWPDRTFIAERAGEGWRILTYADARHQVNAIAAALIQRGLSAERPIMILSGNAIDHALLMLAGYTTGVPVAPISVAYSLQSQDHARLKHIFSVLTPGLVYVADTGAFAAALNSLDLKGVEIVASRNSAGREGVTSFAELTAIEPGPAVEEALSRTDAGTIAKFLFTSGSTGLPKGVVNTHGMLSANQQQLAQIWPFLAEQPLVLVDWLPWNHTFGANHNFNLVLRQAGTLYIDGGKPAPELVVETLRNLREVSPTVYFNVPAGYAALLPHLEQDAILARTFFAKLRMIFYAGAALPQDLWARLDKLAVRTAGERIPMTSSWGTTETAPLATAAHFLTDRAGAVGVPVPGVEIKLVPGADKLEVRVRGPNIMPGYWKAPDLTAAAFDEEGFYKPGDAMRLIDLAAHDKGIAFDGRISEDFKLTTGTWVHVGVVRTGALAAASPVVLDAIIAGENRAFISMLVWLNIAGCRQLLQQRLGLQAQLTNAEYASHPLIREHVRAGIVRWNAGHPMSSAKISRALLLPDQPSIDANEITDKGYINQRLALEHRRDAVELLFAEQPEPAVIPFA